MARERNLQPQQVSAAPDLSSRLPGRGRRPKIRDRGGTAAAVSLGSVPHRPSALRSRVALRLPGMTHGEDCTPSRALFTPLCRLRRHLPLKGGDVGAWGSARVSSQPLWGRMDPGSALRLAGVTSVGRQVCAPLLRPARGQERPEDKTGAGAVTAAPVGRGGVLKLEGGAEPLQTRKGSRHLQFQDSRTVTPASRPPRVTSA